MPIISELISGGAEGILKGLGDFGIKIRTAITGVSPDDQAKLNALALEYEGKIAELNTNLQVVINQTMQAESKSEHWAQWLWRPVVGFTFSAVVINNYILLPYFVKWIQALAVPSEVWYAMLTILGVASAGRGLVKWQNSKNNGK